MENVKGILTMKHDKDILTSEEKVLAEEYYVVEKKKIELAQKKKFYYLELTIYMTKGKVFWT